MRKLSMVARFAASSAAVGAQVWAIACTPRLHDDFRIVPNVTYLTVGSWEGKLDLYVRRRLEIAYPTLIVFHAGGWTGGAKEVSPSGFPPYHDMGMNVVNVEYRLGAGSAPAAVEDCRCALKWVIRHAKEYGIDPDRIVVSGGSSGGHLALTTGMLPASAGFDRHCPDGDDPKVAAIVSWSGIADVNELLGGPNMKPYAVAWLSGAADKEQTARRVSPLTYIREGLPPVLTIHGDADATVPFAQSVRLHKALTDAGVPNELMTIRGGTHAFTLAERTQAYDKIREFLTQHRVLDPPTPAPPRQ